MSCSFWNLRIRCSRRPSSTVSIGRPPDPPAARHAVENNESRKRPLLGGPGRKTDEQADEETGREGREGAIVQNFSLTLFPLLGTPCLVFVATPCFRRSMRRGLPRGEHGVRCLDKDTNQGGHTWRLLHDERGICIHCDDMRRPGELAKPADAVRAGRIITVAAQRP